eukprot:IDg22161t1
MNRNRFLCSQCRVCYQTTIALGRHLQNAHRSLTNSHDKACLHQSSSRRDATADYCDTENSEENPNPSGDVLNDATVDINIADEGWRKATIGTKFGPNSTVVFRSIDDLVSDIVKNAGGLSSIVTISKRFKERVRVYTSPVDSDSMCSYFESIPTNALLVAFDIYSDETTISNSGS